MTEQGGATPRPLALITGGWRRIGAAIATTLAADGWDLALHAHHPSAFDLALENKLSALGARVRGISGDLADSDYVGRAVHDTALEWAKPPTLLVNCASLFRDDTIADVTVAGLHETLAVNLAAPVLLTRHFAEVLSEAEAGVSGSVVMILDQRVRNPVPDQLSYTMSKQALHQSVRTLARSLAPRVRVNGVAPGLILPTPDYGEDQWRRLGEMMPLGRLAEPAEIASAVAWLARAGAVTGQTIFVDGGASLESWPRDFVDLGK